MTAQRVLADASLTLERVRARVNVNAVQAGARKPFRFFLCGDPGLIAEFRILMLSGQTGATIPFDAAATLETLPQHGDPPVETTDARIVVFFGRAGDRAGADLAPLRALGLPIMALCVDPERPPQGPTKLPAAGMIGDYTVGAIAFEDLRGRVLPHIVDACKGIEIAVGRRLPALRTTVAAKLTRDAALNAVKVAGASAAVEGVPILGVIIGALTSAGDMIAITAIQITLMMQIAATFGKDPELRSLWELLPVVGGGFGWRALARELAGFLPVGGIAIKSAIAYAGTILVGEGATFYELHGRHLSPADGARIYDSAKLAALQLGRELVNRLLRTDGRSDG